MGHAIRYPETTPARCGHASRSSKASAAKHINISKPERSADTEGDQTIS